MYVKGKTNPWEFKAFVLANPFGLAYNMEFCPGSCLRVDGYQDFVSTGNTVLKLATLIPSDKFHELTMDNYFSSIPLFHQLQERGVYCMGTLRLDRAHGLAAIADSELKELKANGEQAFCEYRG